MTREGSVTALPKAKERHCMDVRTMSDEAYNVISRHLISH